MSLKYPDWPGVRFTQEAFDDLLLSARNKFNDKELPMVPSLKLKAHLGDPAAFPLSAEDHEKIRPDLPALSAGPTAPAAEDWAAAGLAGASYRRKAKLLLRHARVFRNWIVPYPTSGLQALLREGMAKAENTYERNWCTLQLALFLANEQADAKTIQAVLNQITTGSDNTIIMRPQDRPLLETVKGLLKKYKMSK